jgi:probable O-glycosylation ligase (exosortase A-associated)
MTWGIARSFPHVQAIALCTLVSSLISGSIRKLPNQLEFFLLAGLWGTFLISTIFAIESDRALVQFQLISKVLLMVFLSVFLIDTEQKLLWMVRAIALSIGFHALKIGLFVIRTGGQSAVDGPDASFLAANNSLGMALAVNAPFLLYLIKLETNKWLRRVLTAMLLLSYPAVAGTFSRGAWLALAAVTFLMFIRGKRRFIGFVVLGVLLLSSPLWLSRIISQQMVSRFDTLRNYDEDQSAQSRFWNWEFCARVGLARPLFGAGFDYYSLKAYAEYFPEFQQRWSGKIWSCHNTPLMIFSEHGFIGLAVMLAILISCWKSLRSLRYAAKVAKQLAWALPYVDMLRAALIGYIVSGMFLDIAYFELFYFIIAVIIILKSQTAVIRRNLVAATANKGRLPGVQIAVRGVG